MTNKIIALRLGTTNKIIALRLGQGRLLLYIYIFIIIDVTIPLHPSHSLGHENS